MQDILQRRLSSPLCFTGKYLIKKKVFPLIYVISPDVLGTEKPAPCGIKALNVIARIER